MKLRNQKSVVTHANEGTAPISFATRVTRWIYFGCLASLTAYLLMLAANQLLYLEARGQIEVEKTQVSPSRHGRLVGIFTAEGRTVAAGDELLRLESTRRCELEADERVDKLSYEILLNERRLALLERRLARKAGDIEAMNLRRALEVDTRVAQDLQRARRDAEALEADAAMVAGELETQRELLAHWRARPTALPEECVDEVIRAPFDATIAAVHRKLHEYANRGEPVLTLLPIAPVARIEAYADFDEIRHWRPGAEAEVEFPDGTGARAVVVEVKSSAYPFAEREYDDYLPAETRLRIHLRPAERDHERAWAALDRMEVRVRLGRDFSIGASAAAAEPSR
ncbi:MAG: HlyD family efflux transporter periplasmic adaptor subunit [Gammaproteobacteria bacterium]